MNEESKKEVVEKTERVEVLGRRGGLSPQIQALCKEFLGREITVTELRLMPYIDFVMKNEQRIDPRKVNQEDRDILSVLRKEGHIEGGWSGLAITKEYYDFVQQVLWLGYVCIIHDEEDTTVWDY